MAASNPISVEGAAATMTYYAGLVGPANTRVTLIFVFGGDIVLLPDENASALGRTDIHIDNLLVGYSCSSVENGVDDNAACADNEPPIPGGFALGVTIGDNGLSPWIPIQLDAETGVTAGVTLAEVDPYIYIDPSNPLASEYTLLISAGVANSPPLSSAPEPSSLAMLVTTLSLGFVVAWRRVEGGL
jgi:hypothetical protein